MKTTLPDLVLEGRVEEIRSSTAAQHRARWIVCVAVDRIIEGDFDGPIFEFAVHSPEKSGLRKGQEIRVAAKGVGGGYTVDPLQWLPRK